MYKEQLFEAIHEIDDKYVTEAIENISNQNKKLKIKTFIKVAIFILCFLAVSGTAYAAYRILSAREVASQFEEEKLADKFSDLSSNPIIEENSTYRGAYLGEVSGKNLCRDNIKANEEKTYFVVAVERKDGQKISEEEKIIVSPFVKGIAPWQFNIYTMGGNAISQVSDHILYSLYECDNLEIFADKGVYLGVTDQVPKTDSYQFDEKTGIITRNNDYPGLNLLFQLDLDVSKADSSKAKKYLQELETTPKENHNSDDSSQITNDHIKDLIENGHQHLDDPEAMIAKSTLVEDSIQEIQEDKNGTLRFFYKDYDIGTSAKAVRKHGKDTITFYGDDGHSIESFVIFEYVDGKYTCKLYTCN